MDRTVSLATAIGIDVLGHSGNLNIIRAVHSTSSALHEVIGILTQLEDKHDMHIDKLVQGKEEFCDVQEGFAYDFRAAYYKIRELGSSSNPEMRYIVNTTTQALEPLLIKLETEKKP